MSETDRSHPVPAPRLRRGAAYLLDCTVAFAAVAASQVLVLAPLRTWLGMKDEWFHSGWNTEAYTLLTISLPVWLYFAWFESSAAGATWGKRAVGLRVADMAGAARISFGRGLYRTLLKLLPWELAHVGNNLPVPMWYADEPSFRIAFGLSGLVLAVQVLLICTDSLGRGWHDRATRTLVIRR